MWPANQVADMDLRVSPAIEAALHKHVEHGIFGYTDPTKGVKKAVMKYYKASSVQREFTSRPLLFHHAIQEVRKNAEVSDIRL